MLPTELQQGLFWAVVQERILDLIGDNAYARAQYFSEMRRVEIG